MSTRVAPNPGTSWLVAGGWLSLLAAALHVACIVGGAEWYRFVGAGEEIARAVDAGALWPHGMTAGIAAMLALWGLYALSGAGRLARLPLLRTGLVAITAIYLLRALVFVPLHLRNPHLTEPVMAWSSVIVAVYGAVHLVGVILAWRAMSAPRTETA